MRKKQLLLTIFIFNLFILPMHTFAADDVVQLTVEGTSKSDNPSQARMDALKEALDKGAYSVISNMITASRAEKNESIIKEKIYLESSKYIQFYKATEPVKKDEVTSLNVTMKISISALREMLDREGLLLQSDDTFTILPIIKIYEKRPPYRSFSWWKDDPLTAPVMIKEQYKSMLMQLQAQTVKGFKVLEPLSMKVSLLDRFKKDSLPLDEAIMLGQEFKAQIILVGEAFVKTGEKSNKLVSTTQWNAYYVQSSRQIADLNRTAELVSSKPTDATVQQVFRQVLNDASKNFFLQLQTEFKKGTFGSQDVLLVFQGDFNSGDLENLKRQLLLKIPEIRALRERRMEKGKITLKGDLVGSVNQLVKKIQSSNFEKMDIKINNITTEQVDLKWSAVGAGG